MEQVVISIEDFKGTSYTPKLFALLGFEDAFLDIYLYKTIAFLQHKYGSHKLSSWFHREGHEDIISVDCNNPVK